MYFINEVSLNYITLELQRRFGDHLNIGLAYNFYSFDLTSSNNDVQGSIQVRHQEPSTDRRRRLLARTLSLK